MVDAVVSYAVEKLGNSS
ncbi:hypothetical protein RDI58_011750 [Solanum bulbocastanum]|uniref:Uncharacterized protein n=1 Tax=Solanum bulbocastanum TaxID=147425 RepID=A0AAN8YGK2_SOLBU